VEEGSNWRERQTVVSDIVLKAVEKRGLGQGCDREERRINGRR